MKTPKMPVGITDEFVDELNSLDIPDIKSKIVVMQQDIAESRAFLKDNEDITDLREKLKLVEGPTRDTTKVLKNRTKYALERLKERGAL